MGEEFRKLRCKISGTGDGYPEALVGKVYFSWCCLNAKGKQKRYKIILKNIKNDIFWNTDWIESEQSENILYLGKEMEMDSDYIVQVYVETDKGEKIESQNEYFSTGIEASEWKAQWLKPYKPEASAPMFRKEFYLTKNVVRAKLYLCGLGYQEAYINGKKVGEDYLSPTWTDYRKRVSYVSYDIKEFLCLGQNIIGIQLGKGWYGKMIGMDIGTLLFSGQISLEYSDGKKEWIYAKGNDGWIVNSDGPIVQDSIYIGEVYDARNEINGWNCPGELSNKHTWDTAIVTEKPEGILVPQNVEEIGCIAKLLPVKIIEPEEQVYVVDFGQNLAGVIQIEINEPENREISIRYSEILDENGNLNTANLRTAQAKDVYISKGEKAIYTPRFTYHGFRYIEVRGLSEILQKNQVCALVLRNKVEKVGAFSSSNELINQIQKMCVWTESNNLHGVPTDCPQRDERLGWLNDLTVRAEEAVYNFHMHRFYRKFLEDIRDAQGKDSGAITDTVPFTRYGNQPADPVCSSYLILGWLLYLHYGDESIIKEFYGDFSAWTEYLSRNTKDGIVNYSYYGDWAAPIDGNLQGSYGAGAVSVITPGKLMSTGFLYYNAVLMCEMAKVLEKKADVEKWNKLAENTKNALNKKYYHESDGTYATNSQASNTFMTWLGISPDKKETMKAIVKDIYDHNIHLTTGNICSRYILEVLTENGYEDLAYELVTQTTYPSWGYMVKNGATTTWERWEYVDKGPLLGMASHNHPMYATVSAWFYRYLLGIQVLKPGFQEFQIKPYVPKKLEWVTGSLDTIKGKIEVNWVQKDVGKIKVMITVPFNTKCILHIPHGCKTEWVMNGEIVNKESAKLEAGKYSVEFERRNEI